MDMTEPPAAAAYEEADRLAYFQALYDGFGRAARAAGTVANRFYTIGADTICLRFAGQALIPQLTPAIAHLEAAPVAAPALTVCLWDSASTGARLPLLVASLVDLLRCNPWEQLDIRRAIKGFHGGRIQTNYEPGSRVLSALDTRRNLALYWAHDAAELPYYEKGSPLKGVLSCWTGSRDCQYVHAGAVGNAAGGVLLAGRGGSGKSTTALACISAGLLYASDDYCLVAADPAPYAYSLYNTAKLGGTKTSAGFRTWCRSSATPSGPTARS